jgi:hypothetical protein
MIHDRRALTGFMLTVTALCLTFAPAAGAAQVQLTSDGPVKLTGTESSFTITAFNTQKVVCHAHYDLGGMFETPHGVTTLPASEFTVTPTFSSCTGYIGETKAPATITLNGCDEEWYLGVAGGPFETSTVVNIWCSETTSAIEIHAYSNSEHKTSICTYKIGPQSGLVGSFTKNLSGGTVTFGGASVTGVEVSRTGILCGGTASTNGGEFDSDAVVSATNEAGEATAIESSH